MSRRAGHARSCGWRGRSSTAAWAESLRAELGWLGSALGPARDADVQLETMSAEVASLGEDAAGARGLLTDARGDRDEARAAMVEALSSERYLDLLADAGRDRAGGRPAGRARRDAGLGLGGRAPPRTSCGEDALGDDAPDEALHAFRIRVKRLRYATELAAHELGRKRADHVVDAAKNVQDVLGEHQDAVVAEERVRAWSAGDAGRRGRGRAADRARQAPSRRRSRLLAPRVAASRATRPRDRAVTPVVRAAGGVVLRDGPDGREVLLIHRHRYGDWTLPKGKCEPDEPDEDCALREVEEETGLVCELLDELASTEYVDGKGRPKRVRYWAMRVVGGELRPAPPEVDEVLLGPARRSARRAHVRARRGAARSPAIPPSDYENAR